jgi:hypothetical protein
MVYVGEGPFSEVDGAKPNTPLKINTYRMLHKKYKLVARMFANLTSSPLYVGLKSFIYEKLNPYNNCKESSET